MVLCVVSKAEGAYLLPKPQPVAMEAEIVAKWLWRCQETLPMTKPKRNLFAELIEGVNALSAVQDGEAMLLLPIDAIDIPDRLRDAPEPSAAMVRRYVKSLAGQMDPARKIPVMPIVVSREPTGRYTVVAGAYRLKLSRSAGETTVHARLCSPEAIHDALHGARTRMRPGSVV